MKQAATTGKIHVEFPGRALVSIEGGSDAALVRAVLDNEVLDGALAQTVLPGVIKALAGTRTLEDMCTLYSTVPGMFIEETVESLVEWGFASHVEGISNPQSDLHTLKYGPM